MLHYLADPELMRWIDVQGRVSGERLWRSLKYECIYLHAFSGGRETRQGIGDWMTFYYPRRPHAAHGGEKLEIMFPPSCEQAVLRGLEHVLVPANNYI